MKNNIVFRYLFESWAEIRKVKWPTRREVVSHTIIVVVSITAATALTAFIDYGLTALVEFLVEKS